MSKALLVPTHKESQIVEQLKRIDCSLDMMKQSLSSLSDRLKSSLREESNEVTLKGANSLSFVPLASKLNDINEIIITFNSHIRDLTERCEL